MELTELSLARKRKWHAEATTTLDLHLTHPLPSDWEQCLDLQSGKMYYVNRKTSMKSWNKPEEQKLDLELNISSGGNSQHQRDKCPSSTINNNNTSSSSSSNINNNSNMVALACQNCHLLVILSRSCPSCPNCKFVHQSLHSSSSNASSSKTIQWSHLN